MKISKIRPIISNFLKHPLFSGSAIMIGGSMVVNVVNYVYHLVFGRFLGPIDYGVLASIYSILYITSIVPLSTSISIVKFISGAKDEKEKVQIYFSIRKFMTIVAVMISLLIIAFAGWISEFLHISESLDVILVAPIVFFSLIALVNQSTAQGNLNFLGVVVPNLFSSIGKFLFGLAFILIGWKVSGAMWGIVIAMVLAYLSSRIYVKDLITKKFFNNFDIRPFLKYSLPVLTQALSFTAIFTLDVILVKHFFNPYEAGIYAALSTLGKIIYFASTPIASTMFPIIVGRKAKGQNYLTIFYLSLLLVTIFSFGITFVYWLFPELVIGILYGARYLSASSNLVWMGLFISFYTLSYLLVNFSLSTGSTKSTFLPLLAAGAQVVVVFFLHSSLLQVIQVSLVISIALFLSLILYLRYNRLTEA